MKLLYIKSINTKRSSTNTPEQKAKYAQESYQRTMHGNKRNSRWNDRDELIVMNAEIPDEEIALLLGRTTKAIRRKRDKLLSNNILL